MSLTTFVIEDVAALRLPLKARLEDVGFDVVAVGSAEEADRIFEEDQDREFDIAILDMHLGKYGENDEEITGAVVGRKLQARQRRHPPEFLIYSRYPTSMYFKQAFDLGVEMFLDKEDAKVSDVVLHTRILALRRALSVDNPEVMNRIQRIVKGSVSGFEAVMGFCRDVFAPILRDHLANISCILLLTDESAAAKPYVERIDVPDVVETATDLCSLQKFVFLQNQEYTLLGEAALEEARIKTSAEAAYVLKGMVFVPLAKSGSMYLSLGVGGEQSEELAGIVAKYFSRALLVDVLNLVHRWTESEARQRGYLEATSSFCLYAGQEQVRLFGQAEDCEEINPDGEYVRRLRRLGEGLRNTGEILTSVKESTKRSKELVEVAEIAEKAREGLEATAALGADTLVGIEGDCRVEGSAEHMRIVMDRTLRWFGGRLMTEVPKGSKPRLRVVLRETEAASEIVFEDSSYRLSDRLREKLFEPFSNGIESWLLGLYLVKVLIENVLSGTIEDRSADLEGELGHRLVMRFPKRPFG